jgi:exodeoxyribonuclease V beta subunit
MRQKFNRTNQARWMEKISAWAAETTCSYQLPEALEKFAQSFLRERTKEGGVVPEHAVFDAIETLLNAPLTLNDLMLTSAMREIREAVAREKRRRGELGLMTC